MSVQIKHRDKIRFGEWSHRYDRSILQHIVFRNSHNMFLSHIVPRYNDKHEIKILDVGCGTGEFIFGLADKLRDAEIHGMDLSFDMTKKAKSKLRDHKIKIKVADVEELPYNAGSFDVLTCSHSFHHYPNKKKAVIEMHRVLKPGGELMIIDGCRDVPAGNLIFKVVELIEKHVYHLLAHEMKGLFNESGFEDINQQRFNFVPLLLTSGVARK